MSEWIPVTEKLPAFDASVLVAEKGEKQPRIAWLTQIRELSSGKYVEFKSDGYDGYTDLNSVTHWQELPAMPDENGK